MTPDAIRQIVQRHAGATFTVITTTDTRHHGLLETMLLEEGVLIVSPNGNSNGRAYLAPQHIVALVP